MQSSARGDPVFLRVVLWLARISAAATVVMFVVIVVASFQRGGRLLHSPRDWVNFALFPLGLCLGYVIAWRKPLHGGLVSLGFLGLFYGWLAVSGQPVQVVPALYPFGAPALLFVYYWFVSRVVKRGST